MALAPGTPLRVEVVSADQLVWEGEASRVIARTTEGDIGILAHHEPLLAVLVPCAVEIEAGERQIVAVDGGFISVDDNRVAILSQYATLASRIDVGEAQRELDEATAAVEPDGPSVEDQLKARDRAEARLRAARKLNGQL